MKGTAYRDIGARTTRVDLAEERLRDHAHISPQTVERLSFRPRIRVADEAAEQDMPGRRPIVPLRADPGAGSHALALLLGRQEAEAVERMPDLVAAVA